MQQQINLYTGLEKKYFHIKVNDIIRYQGYVKKKVSPTKYLVETFSWIDGSRFESHLESINTIYTQNWVFYDCCKDMRAAWEEHCLIYSREERYKRFKEFEQTEFVITNEQPKAITKELLTTKGWIEAIAQREKNYSIKIGDKWFSDFGVCELSKGHFIELKYIINGAFNNIKEITLIEDNNE